MNHAHGAQLLLPFLALLGGCSGPVANDTASDSSGAPATSSSGADTTGGTSTGDVVPTTGADGSSTSTSTGSTGDGSSSEGSTAAPGPVCGDGVVDGDELCDDGNDVEDDGCDTKCKGQAVVLWTQTWDSPAAKDDAIDGIAADGDENLYLAGSVENADLQADALLRKLDKTGKEVLSFTYVGAAGFDDIARSVVVGEDGSIYLGGLELITEDTAKGWVRKFDATGKELWAHERLTDVLDGSALVNGMALAGDELYVIGSEAIGDKNTYQTFIQRLDSKGAEVWTEILASDVSLYKNGLTVTPEGNLLVATGVRDADDQLQPWVGLYDGDGAPLWSKSDYLAGGGYATAAAASPSGQLAVTGVSFQFGDNNIWVASLNPDGGVAWEDYINGDGNDAGFSVAFGAGGELYVGGYVNESKQASNTIVRRYTPAGLAYWTDKYNDEIDLYDTVHSIVVTPTMIVAAGNEFVLKHGDNHWVRAYAP